MTSPRRDPSYAAKNYERAHLEALGGHDLAHEQDQRRVEAECLGDRAAHAVHAEQVGVGERGLVGAQPLLLGLELLARLWWLGLGLGLGLGLELGLGLGFGLGFGFGFG